VKNIGLKTVKLSQTVNFIEKNKLYKEIQDLRKDIFDATKEKEYISEILKNHKKNWNSIMYKIHRQTGVSIKELKEMSINEFYIYKENLINEKPKNG